MAVTEMTVDGTDSKTTCFKQRSRGAAHPRGRWLSIIDKSVSMMTLKNKTIIDRSVVIQTVTVSPKYQVVIPKVIREASFVLDKN